MCSVCWIKSNKWVKLNHKWQVELDLEIISTIEPEKLIQIGNGESNGNISIQPPPRKLIQIEPEMLSTFESEKSSQIENGDLNR